MILVIDNYDSFTFNLVHFLGDVGGECEVWRNDAITPQAVLDRAPEAVVLSPGPCTPNEAGICLDLIKAAAGKLPMLGVCLGHQAIGQAFGGRVIRAPAPMHGKTSRVFHKGTDILQGVASPFTATRYHSLIVDSASLPEVLIPTAWTEDGIHDGHAPPLAADLWRAIPSRKYRQRGRARYPAKLPRYRAWKERPRARCLRCPVALNPSSPGSPPGLC